MKTFLIIIGSIFIYVFGAFITFILCLYCERCEFDADFVYDDIDTDYLWILLIWPLTFWIPLGFLLYLKLKKYAIALTEILYQINHKEDEDDGE